MHLPLPLLTLPLLALLPSPSSPTQPNPATPTPDRLLFPNPNPITCIPHPTLGDVCDQHCHCDGAGTVSCYVPQRECILMCWCPETRAPLPRPSPRRFLGGAVGPSPSSGVEPSPGTAGGARRSGRARAKRPGRFVDEEGEGEGEGKKWRVG